MVRFEKREFAYYNPSNSLGNSNFSYMLMLKPYESAAKESSTGVAVRTDFIIIIIL